MLNDSVLYFLLVAEVVSGQRVHGQWSFQRFQIRIQMIDQRNPSRDVQFRNRLLRDVVEILHEGAECIAVGCDQNSLPGSDGWGYSGFPVHLSTE